MYDEYNNTTVDTYDDDRWALTEWGCLSCILMDYGFDISRISGNVGKHIVEDFMELMEKNGYITKGEPTENDER